jgi:hypothetical protein
MANRAKRLTLAVGLAVLLVSVAGSVLAPHAAARPKKEKVGRFTITTEEVEVEGGTSGTFVAKGSITGSGTASQPFGIGYMLVALRSDAGWINLEVFVSKGTGTTPNAFEVTYATGDYARVRGAKGSYSQDVTYPDGPDGPFVIYRTFRAGGPRKG